MAKNKTEEALGVQPAEASAPKVAANVVKISDILALSLKYWYWIVFSVVICAFFAWYSNEKATPLYTQSMAVLLRDDVQGNGTGGTSINLAELGLNQTYTILEDEMEALRSPDLMEQVVVALNLTTLYSSPEGLHERELYGSTLPIKVSFPDMQPTESASFTLHIAEDGQMTVEKLKVNEESFKLNPESKLEFGDAINTPSGRIIIQKTPFLKEGEKYEIKVTQLPLVTATNMFGSEISVDHSANKRSNVIDIVCVDSNMDRADDIPMLKNKKGLSAFCRRRI